MPETYKQAEINWLHSDAEFNTLYPPEIQLLAHHHWTSLDIAVKAARFLAGSERVKVLDIGSGVGKFCLAAAYHTPLAFYYGVEQRKTLIEHAELAKDQLNIRNVSFIHGNFTQLVLKNFDHFYFYNSFYENLAGSDKIDDSIDYSRELFNYYNYYLFKQLEQKPRGTRLCTLCSWGDEIPPGFHVVKSEMDDMLKFWVKV